MDKQVKIKWLEALRSKNYKQGVGGLRCKDQFCCLGVLYDTLGYKWKKIEMGSYAVKTTYGLESRYLETELREELGISDSEECVLVAMNDKKISFDGIADHIEDNL